MKLILRYAIKCFLFLVICAGSTTNSLAQAVPIEQSLPSVGPHWAQQSNKKVRYVGYSDWVDAYDEAVRQANVSLCSKRTSSARLRPRLPGVNGATIAWRTGTEDRYDWRINVGDVVWADDAQDGVLKVGDAVLSVLEKIPPAKRKVEIAPDLTLPKLDPGRSEIEKLLAHRDPAAGGYFFMRYRDGLVSPIETTRLYSPVPTVCGGGALVSLGGWSVSLYTIVNNKTGRKALIDEDPNRYYRGSGRPDFLRFTADVFSEEQARWMIVDQFAADLSEWMFGKIDRDRFDLAMRQLEASTAVRLGYPVKTEAFGKNWRARAAFVAVYAGLRLHLTEASYVSFLDKRDKVVGGGINLARAAVRSDILRQWFLAASQNTNRNQMTAADILDSVKLMSDNMTSGGIAKHSSVSPAKLETPVPVQP